MKSDIFEGFNGTKLRMNTKITSFLNQ